MSEIAEAHGRPSIEAAPPLISPERAASLFAAYLAAMEAEGQGNVTVAEINAAIGGRSKEQP